MLGPCQAPGFEDARDSMMIYRWEMHEQQSLDTSEKQHEQGAETHKYVCVICMYVYVSYVCVMCICVYTCMMCVYVVCYVHICVLYGMCVYVCASVLLRGWKMDERENLLSWPPHIPSLIQPWIRTLENVSPG